MCFFEDWAQDISLGFCPSCRMVKSVFHVWINVGTYTHATAIDVEENITVEITGKV